MTIEPERTYHSNKGKTYKLRQEAGATAPSLNASQLERVTGTPRHRIRAMFARGEVDPLLILRYKPTVLVRQKPFLQRLDELKALIEQTAPEMRDSLPGPADMLLTREELQERYFPRPAGTPVTADVLPPVPATPDEPRI